MVTLGERPGGKLSLGSGSSLSHLSSPGPVSSPFLTLSPPHSKGLGVEFHVFNYTCLAGKTLWTRLGSNDKASDSD